MRSASMMPPIKTTITANGSVSSAHTPDRECVISVNVSDEVHRVEELNGEEGPARNHKKKTPNMRP